MSQKILITGGTGLVGSVLIPMLKAKGHQIVVLGRNKKKYVIIRSRVRLHRREFLKGVDTVLHQAIENGHSTLTSITFGI